MSWQPFRSDPNFSAVLNRVADTFGEDTREKLVLLAKMDQKHSAFFLKKTVGIACLTYLRFRSIDGRSPEERFRLWERLAKSSGELLDTLQKLSPSMAISLELESRARAHMQSLYIQPAVRLTNSGELEFLRAKEQPDLVNEMRRIAQIRDASLCYVRVYKKNKRRGRHPEMLVREAVCGLLRVWEEYAGVRATQTKNGAFEQYVELSLRAVLPMSWSSKSFESPIQDVLDGTWTGGWLPIATLPLEDDELNRRWNATRKMNTPNTDSKSFEIPKDAEIQF